MSRERPDHPLIDRHGMRCGMWNSQTQRYPEDITGHNATKLALARNRRKSCITARNTVPGKRRGRDSNPRSA
jgi:hypothetical protein